MNLVKSIALFLLWILTCYRHHETIATSSSNVSMARSPNHTAVSAENITTGKPVKLTMKQGLIMNQVVATYALNDPSDPLCKTHTEIFKEGLRQLQPWALQMFDSSSKLQSGILTGNLVEYGAFRACLKIYKDTEIGAMRGKHCTFGITPGENLLRTVLGFRGVSSKRFDKLRSSLLDGVQLGWSVCVPDSCPSKDILTHFNKTIMEVAEGLDIKVSLTEENCETLQTLPEWTLKEFSFIAFTGTIVLVVVVSTIIDHCGKSNRIVEIFSAIANGKRMIRNNQSELDCLHGIRFLSICHIIIGHRFMAAMIYPSINSLDLLDWVLNYTNTIIIGGSVFVDSFLLVSATLVSYVFFENVAKNGRFNLARFYVRRYMRITVPLIIPVIFHSSLVQLMGSGPLYRDAYESMQKPCQYFWWSTLLHIQAYVNPQFLCMTQTWYLGCDMLYYYFSPVILIPLWKWPKLGYVNLFFWYILSVLINFYLAWINEYVGGMPLTRHLLQTQYLQRHYIAPHVRASPYIIGLGFGYAIFRTKGKKITMNFVTNLFGWMATIIFMTSALVGSHVFQDENHDYNRLESSLFLSCSRSAWVLGIVWIIWVCVHGYGGFVNSILSMDVFRILGKLGYGIYLVHLGNQTMQIGAMKTPGHFSNFECIYQSLADFILSLLPASLLTFCIEYPCLQVEALLLNNKQNGARDSYTRQ